jgi:hypothetical protein
MNFFLLAAVCIVTALSNNKSKSNASASIADVIDRCEVELMTAQDCAALLVGNGYSTAVITAKDANGNDALDIFYYQVLMNVDFYGNVLGSPLQLDGTVPLFDGIVSYPYVWLGGPVRNRGNRRVGPWDCKNLSHIQCCAKIETDISDIDVNGNYLSCFQQMPYYEDPTTHDRFRVYRNPETGSISFLTLANITSVELNEQGSRNELIQMIDQAVISKNCSKAFLQSIHARFLHSMRGVDKARAHAKHTKEAIRRMNHAEVSYIDATQDPELQQWLPKMKDVINSVSTNGGLQRVWLDKNT